MDEITTMDEITSSSSGSLPTNLASSSPVTNSPITNSPITSSPITDSPATSSPITSSPITNSPITSPPITSSPITNSPITNSPITSFPKAILSVSREEFYGQDAAHAPLALTIRDGKTDQSTFLPEDLQGHLFIVSPAGSVDSQVIPNHPLTVLPGADGWSPVLNGDGMVYRLDFHRTPIMEPQPLEDQELGDRPTTDHPATDHPEPNASSQFESATGRAWLATRLVKTPSFYVDDVLQNHPERYPNLSRLKFKTWGIARLSKGFGTCNQNNTALVPLKFAQQPERLLVTEDIGRPWEIDPYCLKLVAPVGRNQDWQGVVYNPLWQLWPFPPVMNSAHPVFDANTGEFFSVNIVKSFSTLLNFTHWLVYKLQAFKIPYRAGIAKMVKWFQEGFDALVLKLFKQGSDRLYLVRWNGQDPNTTQWLVTLPKQQPIQIEQTLHQMGISDRYIVLADTSLKLALDNFIPRKADCQDEETLWREIVRFPQLANTNLYLVDRHDLQPGVASVVAQKVALQEALVHFLVDYYSPNGNLIFHTAHINAWDTSEFLHGVDRLKLAAQFPQALAMGMVSTATDVNRLTSYVIDPQTGQTQRTDVNYSKLPLQKYPWAIAFLAYRDNTDHQPNTQFTDIYWNSWGLWGDLITDFVYDLYKDYDPRILPINTVLDQARNGGICGQLSHVQITHQQSPDKPLELVLELVDQYLFPTGYFGTSVQFVPRQGSTAQRDGYLVCIMIHSDHLLPDQTGNPDWSDNSELWIFDATNLEVGPLYKLSHPKLNFGFTAHTAWLGNIQHPPSRNYSIREDFAYWVNHLSHNWLQQVLDVVDGDLNPEATLQELKALFETDVFPNFQ